MEKAGPSPSGPSYARFARPVTHISTSGFAAVRFKSWISGNLKYQNTYPVHKWARLYGKFYFFRGWCGIIAWYRKTGTSCILSWVMPPFAFVRPNPSNPPNYFMPSNIIRKMLLIIIFSVLFSASINTMELGTGAQYPVQFLTQTIQIYILFGSNSIYMGYIWIGTKINFIMTSLIQYKHHGINKFSTVYHY